MKKVVLLRDLDPESIPGTHLQKLIHTWDKLDSAIHHGRLKARRTFHSS